jgi:hypothetical protein
LNYFCETLFDSICFSILEENNLVSMEELSTSLDSPHPESLSLSCEESVYWSDPEQTEPLCLVTRKNDNIPSDLPQSSARKFAQQTCDHFF